MWSWPKIVHREESRACDKGMLMFLFELQDLFHLTSAVEAFTTTIEICGFLEYKNIDRCDIYKEITMDYHFCEPTFLLLCHVEDDGCTFYQTDGWVSHQCLLFLYPI